MFTHFVPSSHRRKTVVAICHDVLIIIVSFYLSLALRKGELLPKSLYVDYFGYYLLTIITTQLISLIGCGLYRGIWRYSSTHDLIRVIKASFLATIFSYLILFFVFRLEGIPRSSIFINFTLLVVLLGGGRLIYRIFRDSSQTRGLKSDALNVLIIGAGGGGEQIFREIRKNSELNMKVVGFLDNDPGKIGRMLHGTPIFGPIGIIKSIYKKYSVNLVYIAIPSATGEEIRRIYEKANEENIHIKTLPKISDILHGSVKLSQLRDIEVEDILGRKQVNLDSTSLNSMITGKVIMISGAGGSIGSEIVRQIAAYEPKELILVDNSEFNLYSLEMNLKENFPELSYKILMADVKDQKTMEAIISSQPDAIFHAAAYKHVPLVENNPQAAIATNGIGTQVIASLACKHKIKRFVMVSTDKAVNPTNIMGASKRIAELICLKEQEKTTATKFMIVRFGNVLGSSGSVIPLFKKQIAQGGPITVTHPDITRYFMSIPEASQLVLQAAAIGHGGEIFVLDMGEPIKILEVARQMIQLSGLKENIDIKIEFVGLRVGEKMFEELLLDSESVLPTIHPMVKIAKAASTTVDFEVKLKCLFDTSHNTKIYEIRNLIKGLVPEYTPKNFEDKEVTNTEIEKNLH